MTPEQEKKWKNDFSKSEQALSTNKNSWTYEILEAGYLAGRQKAQKEIDDMTKKLEAWGQNKLVRTLQLRLQNCESLLLKFVPHPETIQWEERELRAKEYFEFKPLVRPLDYVKEIRLLKEENEKLKKQTAIKRCMDCGNIALNTYGVEILTELKKERDCVDYVESLENYEEFPATRIAKAAKLAYQTQQQRKVKL